MPMICGVDEAGKGSVLGPMVIAAVACPRLDDLSSLGVADSKKLSKSRREELNTIIRADFPHSVVIRSAEEIDTLRLSMTMNEIVARAHAEAIDQLSCTTAYLDACDANEKRYAETIRGLIKKPVEIIAAHKADSLFPPVSAASIVAKVERDRLIEDLSLEYGLIGSGYPSDPVTITYLKEYIASNNKPPVIARSSWETVKHLLHAKDQRSLLDF